MSSEFFEGRRQASLRSTAWGYASDAFFAGERYEEKTLEGGTYENCTFANISLKDTELRRCHFKNCVFLRAYLRRTKFVSCELVACKFISCEFPAAVFDSSKLLYVSFERCYPELKGIITSLPHEANLLHALTANLSREAESLGESEHARDFKLIALQARERSLSAAWRNDGDWYRKHFDGFLSRVRALRWLLASRLEGLVWGHGERLQFLFANLVLAVFLFFPTLYYWGRAGFEPASALQGAEASAASITYQDVVFHSMDTILTGVGLTDLRAASPFLRSAMFAEVVLGMVGAGLVVTYLFRSILRRSVRMLRT